MKKNIALIFLFISNTIFLYAQNDWELSRDENQIKVYTRKDKNSKFKSVKVECNVAGTIEKLVTILKNVDGNLRWVYNTKHTQSVRTISLNEFIYYAETSLPWPLRNRDVVIDMLFNRDSSGKMLTVKATGMQGEVGEKDGIVRIPYFNGLWEVSAADDGHIIIHYVLAVDPGGSVPAWAYNMFVTKGPYNTFKNLSELLQKE